MLGGTVELGPAFYGGVGAMAAGLGLLLVGMRYSGNITPVGRANSMAEEYNRDLAMQIKQM
jgi:hypothetical protein